MADGDLVISRADGASFEIQVTNDGTGGFSGSDFTGTTAIDNGAVAQSALPLTLTSGDLTFAIGDADAVEVTGTFASNQALVDEINTVVGGNAQATLAESTAGVFTIEVTAGDDITVVDTQGVFTAGTEAASGNLADDVNVLTVDAANNAINRIDSALTSISDLRSTFGSIQNRFESTIENLTTTSENLSASRSRILDADFAAETANLTRVQILQQAGISVLSQANVQPQNVLALLQ